jgi:hypothetical protein
MKMPKAIPLLLWSPLRTSNPFGGISIFKFKTQNKQEAKEELDSKTTRQQTGHKGHLLRDLTFLGLTVERGASLETTEVNEVGM